MILGVGMDLMDTTRLAALELPGDPFFSRAFTSRELDEALSRENPLMHLCTKFSIKEAALKALNVSDAGAAFNMIEVLNEPGGRPVVQLYKAMRTVADTLGVKYIFASASFDGKYSAAVVICSN